METIYHSNKYHAGAACHNCEGIIRHETWCIEVNQFIRLAYLAIFDPQYLTDDDRKWLKAMQTEWPKIMKQATSGFVPLQDLLRS